MNQANVDLPEYEATVSELVDDLKRFRAANVTLENAIAVLDLARDELTTAKRQSEELEQAAIEVLQQVHELDPSALRRDVNETLTSLRAALDSLGETQARTINDLSQANRSAQEATTKRLEDLDDRLDVIENQVIGLTEAVGVVQAEVVKTKDTAAQGIEIGREAVQTTGTIVPSMVEQIRTPLDDHLKRVAKRQDTLILLGIIGVIGILAILYLALR